jgi:hypothetical protein
MYRLLKDLKKNLQEDVTEAMLFILLEAMSLMFVFDRNFRKNIVNFNARYSFTDRTRGIHTGVVFKDGIMKVVDEAVADPTAEIEFKDAAALRKFLFSSDGDIINAILENSINTFGNLNYVLKFGFMAKHLQLAFLK